MGSGRGIKSAQAGVLAEVEAEQSTIAELSADQRLGQVGGQSAEDVKRRLLGLRQPEKEAVVVMKAGGFDSHPFEQLRLNRKLEPLVELAPEGCEHCQAGVARLVNERLNEDGPIVGNTATEASLSGDELEQKLGGARLQAIFALEPFTGVGIVGPFGQLPAEGTNGFAKLGRSWRHLSSPEGHQRRPSRRRAHDHPLRLDRLDPPGRGAEHERLSHATFEHELLVELSQAWPSFTEVNRIVARFGDRPAGCQSQPSGTGKRRKAIVNAVPAHPCSQIPERADRKPAAHHFQDTLKRRRGEVAVRIRPAHEVEKVQNVPAIDHDGGNDLLGKDVEAVGRDVELFDFSGRHLAAECGGFEQVARGLCDQPTLTDASHDMPRSADALEPPRNASRRFDLTDKVYRPHVNPQLQRGRGDNGRQLASLEGLFGQPAFELIQRSVMRSNQLDGWVVFIFRRTFIESRRETLGDPAVVREDDRRSMRLHEIQEPALDSRPD